MRTLSRTHKRTEAAIKTRHTQPEIYEIRLQGHLDARWASWFEGMAITRTEDGETVLTGPVADQAALHGLLKKVRDLGIPLRSLRRLSPNRAARWAASRQFFSRRFSQRRK